MSRLLWFIIGSAATLVVGAVAANCMDDDSDSAVGPNNDLTDEVGDKKVFDEPGLIANK